MSQFTQCFRYFPFKKNVYKKEWKKEVNFVQKNLKSRHKKSVINGGGGELSKALRINFKTTVCATAPVRGCCTTEWSAFWHSFNLRSGPPTSIVGFLLSSWDGSWSSAGAQCSMAGGHSRTATKNLMSNKYKTKPCPELADFLILKVNWKKVSFHSVTIYVFKCGLFSTGEWRVRTRYRTMPNVLLRRVVLLRDAPTKPKFLKLFGQPCPEAEIVKCLKGL